MHRPQWSSSESVLSNNNTMWTYESLKYNNQYVFTHDKGTRPQANEPYYSFLSVPKTPLDYNNNTCQVVKQNRSGHWMDTRC